MKIPLVKFKAILRYFCTNTSPELLGKTKLMKLFYFVDFRHVKEFGAPITYDQYFHLEHGPIPTKVLNMVSNLIEYGENAILSDTIKVVQSPGEKIQKIECLEKFSKKDEGLFSKNELRIMDKICSRYWGDNAKKLEELSHKEAPWRLTKDSEEIPYTLAAEDKDSLVDKEIIELSLEVA